MSLLYFSYGEAMPHDYAIIIMTIFLASLIRSITGFGDALVSMPILLFFFPIADADSIVSSYGLIIGLLLMKTQGSILKDYKKELIFLLVFSIPGVIIGALSLKYISTHYIILILSLILITYPFIYFYSGRDFTLTARGLNASFFGLLGGFLGGAVNTNGPPFAIYGQLRKFPPQVLIAMFQPLFVLGNIFNVVTYTGLGLFSYRFAAIIIALSPLIAAIVFWGQRIRNRVNHKMDSIVISLIFISGVASLIKQCFL